MKNKVVSRVLRNWTYDKLTCYKARIKGKPLGKLVFVLKMANIVNISK